MARASAVGVDRVVIPGIDLQTSEQARAIARGLGPNSKWSAGLHPHDAAKWRVEGAELAELAATADAIGECGLDFYRNLSPRETQLEVFREHLELAAELAKPVIVHCRDAFADTHTELERAQLGGAAILHCWTGGPRWTKRFRELGVTFSFAGPVTFETGETVRFGAAEAPPERTMVETDTPYLTPPPHRRSLNEPANTVAVGRALAEVWSVDLQSVAESTSQVAASVFGWEGTGS